MKNLMVWFVNLDSATRGAVLALAGVIGAALITGIFSVITTVLGKSKKIQQGKFHFNQSNYRYK